MKQPYFVSEFTSDNHSFSNIIKHNIKVNLESVTQKRQLRSIVRLLSELGAKTMVSENEYIDNGYLEDYLNYYVGCHEAYPKYCTRIHFFTQSFEHDIFEQSLLLDSEGAITEQLGEYLGFIVIKPIPMTFIGRTCLKSPVDNFAENSKLISRIYKANLFGLQLEVQAVAFQEQDQVVSACTSASIWCLLHGLQIKPIKSPAQITQAATETSKVINTFPNLGLSPVEIERALEYFSLRQYTVSPKGSTQSDIQQLTEYIRTFVDSDIPLILGAECLGLVELDEVEQPLDATQANLPSKYRELGKHAVTVIGYELDDKHELKKLIVHDDREGPYTVLEFKNNYEAGNRGKLTALIESSQLAETNISTSFQCKEIMIYSSLIIGIDPRVRISFDIVSRTETKLVTLLNEHFAALQQKSASASTPIIHTKTRLVRSCDYKQHIKENPYKNKAAILTYCFPKYLWIIECEMNGEDSFDFIFDSSSLPQGKSFICACHKEGWTEELMFEISKLYYNQELKERSEYRFRDSDFLLQVLNSLKNETNNFFSYHDEHFGKACMPKLIKATEISNEQLNDSKNQLILYNKQDNEKDGINRFRQLLDKQEAKSIQFRYKDEEPKFSARKLIWIISEYGALYIGPDSNETGHPTLTGAKAARIGGEFIEKVDESGKIYLNYYSGRYSYNFKNDEVRFKFLQNALLKIDSILGTQDITFINDPGMKVV
ncbi:hypothetical protein AB4476_19790 [Vibrio splendidus]